VGPRHDTHRTVGAPRFFFSGSGFDALFSLPFLGAGVGFLEALTALSLAWSCFLLDMSGKKRDVCRSDRCPVR
jgi:hypothetical protein